MTKNSWPDVESRMREKKNNKLYKQELYAFWYVVIVLNRIYTQIWLSLQENKRLKPKTAEWVMVDMRHEHNNDGNGFGQYITVSTKHVCDL